MGDTLVTAVVVSLLLDLGDFEVDLDVDLDFELELEG